MPQDKTYTSEDYWNLPEGERAELIDGDLIMMAPPSPIHQDIIAALVSSIYGFIKENSGNCKVYPAPFAVNLSGNDTTWVEPDISVICDKDKISHRGCEGAPDWIIEVVSPSSQSHDYLKKLLLYQKNGVREYWIINPAAKVINVYIFETGESASYTFHDTIPVGIYKGLFRICLAQIL